MYACLETITKHCQTEESVISLGFLPRATLTMSSTVAASLPEPTNDSTDRRLVYPELLSHLSLRMACFRQCDNSYGTFLFSDGVSFHCGSLCPATTYGIG